MSTNQLSQETSPYLLQHKDNPVHWMAWSEQAFAQAKREDKPVLLSIGYAACHWCHVMAHESFEDQETADLMNANFINIKVDREERPDVDKVYMAALHSLGEQGGWPLTMFLTPEVEPFWGGTYFPPEPRYGRPGFKQILVEISRIWRLERHRVSANSSAVLAALNREVPGGHSIPDLQEVRRVAMAILGLVDSERGGLKGAPKFPQSPIFEFLWSASLHLGEPQLGVAAITTATSISQGGIYDHLGGGIARYSVDDRWLVPHFEKMLYDNAQFVSLLTRIWLTTQNPLFRCRIEETVNFIFSDLLTPEGLFASSFDADSEGHEGRFYIWSKAEIELVLGREASEKFCGIYDVTEQGNWEGSNILHRSASRSFEDSAEQQLAASRAALKARRNKRVWPQRDHKVLADWNGLAIGALAEAAFAFNRPDWANRAETAMSSLLGIHWQEGRLLHTSTGNTARHEATAEDYAYLITALRALHLLTGNGNHTDTAIKLSNTLVQHHWDEKSGGFHFASKKVTELPAQTRNIHDDVTPNANALMIVNFASLGLLTGRDEYLEKAHRISEAFALEARNSPAGAATYFRSCIQLADSIHVTAVGKIDERLLHDVIDHTGFDIIAHRTPAAEALPAGHLAFSISANDRVPAIYLCRGQTCAAPIRSHADLQNALKILNLTP